MNVADFYDELDSLYSQQKYSEVETFLNDSLKSAELDENWSAMVSVYNEMGGYYRVTTQFDKGENSLDLAIKILERENLLKTEGGAVTLLNYATLLTAAKRTDEAIEKYEQAGKVFYLSGNLYHAAALHNNIAGMYLQIGKYDSAESNVNQALEIVKTLQNAEEEIAVSNTTKAEIYFIRGDMGKAEVFLRSAQGNFAAAKNYSPVHYAAFLSMKAALHCKQERYPEAVRDYEEALKILESSVGKNQTYNMIKSNLDICLRDMKNADRVELNNDKEV